MSQDRSKDLLRRLSLAPGPPGAEDAVRRIVRETLDGTGSIRHDRLGSLLCEKRGGAEAPRIVLDSHLDEVAFMIQSVTKEGYLAFVTLGGWWPHVMLGQRVDVLTDGGVVPGLIGGKPPHFLAPEERKRLLEPDAMFIDVGASDAEAVSRLGVRVGDMAVPHAEYAEMGIGDVFSGKAFDNRIGVALMCETLLALRDREHPNTVIGIGAVQEELGARGAQTSTTLARPDVALVLECTPADDSPGQTICQGALGRGPQIRYFDPTAVSNRRLVRLVEDTARECDVAIQTAVRRSGGTDAGAIHRSADGVPTVVIGVPARYIHSHVGLLDWRDYEAARRLPLELVVRLDATRVEALTRFD